MNAEIFSNVDFDPEKYTRGIFRSNTLDHVKSLRNDLETQLQASATQLQQCVFANYPVFIATSKEMSAMESDLGVIDSKLNDLFSLLKPLEAPPADKPGSVDEVSEEAEDAANETFGDGATQDDGKGLGAGEDEGDEEEVVDLFDIALSKRDFDQCVELIEDGAVGARRADSLCSLMLDELTRSGSSRLVSLLTRCGQRAEARAAFLRSKGEWLLVEIRRVKISGDACSFAEEVSFLCFSSIRSTCNDYAQLFKEPADASFLVSWATEIIAFYVDLMNRQVFALADFASLTKCVEIAHDECQTLQKKGLSMSFYLAAQFRPIVETRIRTFFRETADKLLKGCASEQWVATEITVADTGEQQLQAEKDRKDADKSASRNKQMSKEAPKEEKPIPTRKLHIVESGLWMYETMQEIVVHMKRLSVDLRSQIVDGMVSLLQLYIAAQLTPRIHAGTLKDKQAVAILATVFAIMDDLVPRIEEETGALIAANIGPADEELAHLFAQSKATLVVRDRLVAGDDGQSMQQCLMYLSKLGELMLLQLPAEMASDVMRHIADSIWEHLPEGLSEGDVQFARSFLCIEDDGSDQHEVHALCHSAALEPAYLSLRKLLLL